MPTTIRRSALLTVAVLVLGSSHAFANTAGAAPPTPIATRSPAKVPTTTDVLVEYQRVGRDLLTLRDQRGRFDIGDLMPRFRAIKLDHAVATAAARVGTAATLAEIASKIERLRGITVGTQCLDNPLADGCR